MVRLTNTESELIDQLLDCLNEAIEGLPQIEIEYANKTKVQKLLYLAIDEFDIPITHSWYLAGAVVPVRSIGPDTLSGQDVSPEYPSGPSLDSISDSVVSSEADSPPLDPIMFTGDSDTDSEMASPFDLEAYASRDEIVLFLRQVIPEVWHEQTMRFLQNFYEEMSPDEYQLLYIESTHLRTHLAGVEEAIKNHINGQNPPRSIKALRNSIELSISDLHFYLRQNPKLRETFDIVVEGTDLIEDAIMMIDQRPLSEFTKSDRQLLTELQEFFYYYVWKYPCLLISQETAAGPSADELRSKHETAFENFEERVRNQRENLEARLDTEHLLSGPTDYPPFEDDEVAQTLSDLSSEYFE